MILLASKKWVCRKAFDLYCAALKRKQLPIHLPKEPGQYSKQFYAGKSHLPYFWGNHTIGRRIPWIQFVGYQIRYDGLVRVRRKSVQKELKKITSKADAFTEHARTR
jgi:hypothetical protein